MEARIVADDAAYDVFSRFSSADVISVHTRLKLAYAGVKLRPAGIVPHI